jgi:hypothetical protein
MGKHANRLQKETIIFVAFALLSAAGLYWALSGNVVACIKGDTSEHLQKTVQALNETIELGIKLSVTAIGGGIALLLGFKTNLLLSKPAQITLLMAILLFGQSALLGVFWRLRLANAWLNECLNLVYEGGMQNTFNGSLYYFGTGVAVALIMVLFLSHSNKEKIK